MNNEKIIKAMEEAMRLMHVMPLEEKLYIQEQFTLAWAEGLDVPW